MKDFLDKHFQFVIMVGIILFLLYSRMQEKGNSAQPPTVVVVSDTTDKHHIGQVTTVPTVYQTIPYPVDRLTQQYLPDTNYARLRVQFEELRDKYLATNVQKDSTKVDSLGTVRVTDSVSQNKVFNRKWEFDIKERIINTTTTITKYAAPKRQLYFGAGVGATTSYKISQVEGGLLYKDKKDRVFGAVGNYNTLVPNPQDRFSIKLSSYWILHLGKK
jgi:hypothetical protein